MCGFLSEQIKSEVQAQVNPVVGGDVGGRFLQWTRHSCACDCSSLFLKLTDVKRERALVCRCPLGSTLLISPRSPQITVNLILQTRIVVDRGLAGCYSEESIPCQGSGSKAHGLCLVYLPL